MPRTFFAGFEVAETAISSLADGIGPGLSPGTTIAYDTVIKRSGRSSGKIAPASGTAAYFILATGNNFGNYNRIYVRVTGRPATTARNIIGSTAGIQLRLNPNGTIAYFNATTLIGTSTTALTDTTAWYRLEWRSLNGTSVPILLINGTTEVTGSPATWTNTAYVGANDSVADTYTVYFDDLAVDDTAFPGDGAVALLVPTADSARAGWTGGIGGTTNLWDAVNNLPPTGQASASATDASQIEHPGGAVAADNYDATMQTYDTYVPAGSTVNAVMAVTVTGEDIATGDKTMSHQILSNPVGTSSGSYNVASAGAAVAIGAYPTNWFRHAVVDSAPVVALSTAPVLRITRPVTETRVASVCLMAIVVEYTPPVASADPFPAGYYRPKQDSSTLLRM